MRLLLASAGIVLLGCSPVDIRTEALKEHGYAATSQEQGRALLLQAAHRHGLEAWQSFATIEATAIDRWAEGASGWWPEPEQRFRMQAILGTFTSRVELLGGKGAGEVWGIQAWRAYTRRQKGGPVRFEPGSDALTAMTFYLPALQYFNALPFRLLTAEYVAYAGVGTHRGQVYDLVYVTWGSFTPNEMHDQYLLWISRASGLIEMCRYTLRDIQPPHFTGTIHFDDYRSVQGVLFPFKQTVVLPPPEHTLYPLDENYYHRLVFEAVQFDAVQKEQLLVDSTRAVGDVKATAP